LIRVLGQDKSGFDVISSTRQDTDLFDIKQTQTLIESTQPDILIIAAARVGGIVANNTKRTEFIMENLKINMNLLEASIPFPKMRIINLGSSCIYPLDAKDPISEESIMTGKLEPTNSPYAMAKLTAIEIGNSLNSQYGHKVINLMPTNLYGPNDFYSDTDSHVIPGLIYRMHAAKTSNLMNFDIWGTGSPLREFLYVDDLALAIKFIINNDVTDELINIGSGDEITIKNLAIKIKSVVKYEGNLNFDKTKPDGNPRKLLDSSKINKLGWMSTKSLDEGLKISYKWFLENNN
tara:strand:+ start:38965 stop:39840 length:876 start_codon:yes stop_codon:yes gene_type:complete